MKKVLSLVLAFAMILGSFAFVFASDFPDVSDTEYFSEPVSVLSGLGVIGGFPDGTFGPEKEVTRAQMATMIVNALGMTVTGKADTKFSDVPASHWASGFINYAASVGFIAGYPDGTFKPDTQVTYDQALTMIVAALGYKAESLTGTWPGNFVNQARGLGILNTCNTTGTAKAPRQDIACFLYDALTAFIGTTDKDGAFHPTEVAKGKYDCMLHRLGATEYKPDSEGNAQAFIVDDSEMSKAAIDLRKYMGANITAYANKDGKVVAVKEVLSEYIEGTYKELGDAYKLNGKDATSVVYFKNGDENGKITMKDASIAKENLKVAVELNGKKIDKIFSIQAWIPETTFSFEEDMADAFEAKKPKIGGVPFVLDEDTDKIDESAYELVGRDSLADIKEGDIVTVYKGKEGVTKIEVSDKTIEGVITKIKDGKYTIGGTEYGLNRFIDSTDEADLPTLMDKETEATFYLDYSGAIFTFEAEVKKDWAVFLDYKEEGEWKHGSKTKTVNLFLADGTTKSYVDTSETTINPGTLVEYSLNSKDEITAYAAVTDAAATITFDANGIDTNKKALKDSTIAFNFAKGASATDKDKADPDNYSILKVADLYDSKPTAVAKVATTGNYSAILAYEFETADAVYTFFVDKAGTTKDGTLWTALYDGEVKTLTLKKGLADPTKYTTSGAANYTLTFSDDVVTNYDDSKAVSPTPFATNAKGSVSGNVYKLGSNSYSLNKDVVVYVYDGEDWSAEGASFLAKAADYFSYIGGFMTGGSDDKDYDIFIVYVAE